EPLAYCDNSSRLWGTDIAGVPVMSPAAAVEKHRDGACFLVAVYNASPIRRQLRELGCGRIVSYPVFFWKHWRSLPAEERLEKTDSRFRHIYLFEPDPANLRALAARIAAYPPSVASRITTFPFAVGNENGIVRFSANGDAGSKVVRDGGTAEIECRILDTVL